MDPSLVLLRRGDPSEPAAAPVQPLHQPLSVPPPQDAARLSPRGGWRRRGLLPRVGVLSCGDVDGGRCGDLPGGGGGFCRCGCLGGAMMHPLPLGGVAAYAAPAMVDLRMSVLGSEVNSRPADGGVGAIVLPNKGGGPRVPLVPSRRPA
jgi:hypothetical protein